MHTFSTRSLYRAECCAIASHPFIAADRCTTNLAYMSVCQTTWSFTQIYTAYKPLNHNLQCPQILHMHTLSTHTPFHAQSFSYPPPTVYFAYQYQLMLAETRQCWRQTIRTRLFGIPFST